MQGTEGANINGKSTRPTTIPVEEIFPTKHDELIHCLRYDYYGKKIATCSSDQRIKVWEQDASGAWHQTADWKAHKGSIWRVEWVHPRFGSVLISCSFDQSVKVWQETEEEKDGLKVWQKKAEIVDSRDSVVDIKVAPPHEGLRLATCSADGQVRIYEAQDTNNLAHWGLASSFESFGGKGSNCISWNPSFSEPSMIVEGNVDGIVTVWENKSSGAWEVAYQFNGHKGEVLDVAWAPNLGRDCHIIATAARDRTVRLWRLPSRLSPGKFEAHEMAILPHDSTVWQVEWNILGTVLATSTDDGSACVWSSDFYGRWRVVCATTPSGKEMTVPPVSDSGESFELRRTASEGLSLSSLSGRLKEKDKEKEKEKEKESDYLFFGGDEKDVFGVGGGGEESYPSRSVVKQETLIDEELTSSGKKKKTDKTPARSMTLTQKWFGKSNAWK